MKVKFILHSMSCNSYPENMFLNCFTILFMASLNSYLNFYIYLVIMWLRLIQKILMQIKTNTLGIFYHKTGEDCGPWINLNLCLSVQLKKKSKNYRWDNHEMSSYRWMNSIDKLWINCQVPILWTQMNYHRSRWKMTPNHQRSRP